MAKLTGNPTGRPPLYTEELALEICARISAGETLIEICRSEDMPAEVTVRKWVLKDEGGFAALYARARAMQIEHEVEEMKVISNTPVNFEVRTDKQHVTKDGDVIDVTETRYGDSVEHRKLQIETRKWRAGKIAWRIYGDKTRNEVTGAEGQPLQSEVHIFDLPNNGRDPKPDD